MYGTFGSGGNPLGGLGGMMGEPEGTPSHWMVYFGSADVDAAVATLSNGSVAGSCSHRRTRPSAAWRS